MRNDITSEFLSEETYKDLFDSAHDLIQIVNLEGNIIYVNRSWMKLLEYSLEEIQGQSIFSFIEESDRSHFINYRNKIINGHIDDKEIIIRVNTKSGRKISLEGFVSLRKKNNHPYYTRGIFRDITSRLENEAQIKERKYNQQQLLLNAPDAIIVINHKSLITFWNPQAEKMFGWTLDEVVNQPLSLKIIPEQYREAHAKGMKRYLATG
ncbi:MAG: PAS domain-containing protein, partial [Chitinophagaceae bacterium]